MSGEGGDIKGGKIYYTTKSTKYLFIINLDPDANGDLSFVRSSTVSGAFDGQPDQVARVLNFETRQTNGILFFCEVGGAGNKHGVHGCNANGEYFIILREASDYFGGETTGLAFSQDGKHMVVSFQQSGYIFQVWREAGLPFYGAALEIIMTLPTETRRNMFAPNAKTCDLGWAMCIAKNMY